MMASNKKRANEATRDHKGAKISIIGGKYDGHHGWMDCSKKETKKMYYIIMELEDGTEVCTRVCKHNVGAYSKPISYVDHLLAQHRDITKVMNQLAEKLGECELNDPNHRMEIHTKLAQKWEAAIVRNRQAHARKMRFVSDSGGDKKDI